MAYDELMADRVRVALAEHTEDLEDKTMFGGLCFMVEEKMCVCINKEGILCRIGGDAVEKAVEENGVSIMMNGKRPMKDFVYVDADVVQGKRELDYWVGRALVFIRTVKVGKKK